MYDFSDIVNYIIFLKSQLSLLISLHPTPELESLISTSELMTFNIHDNPYCAFIKSNRNARAHCVECQKKVVKKCRNGAFCGTCYAGVRETVYPITSSTGTTGFISVSGYKTNNFPLYRERISAKYGFNTAELNNAYKALNDDLPDKAEIDTLLKPLCNMLELAYLKAENSDIEPTLAERIIRFIKQNRHLSITSKDICEALYCSRSHMSTAFNKATGKTVREYITELRVSDAKQLLTHSDLNVTEIAYSVGFNNSNYFSDIFKKHCGLSPLEYRKSTR